MAAPVYEVDPGGYPFSHYDQWGNPIDTNGQVMLVGPGVGGGGGWYDPAAPGPVEPGPPTGGPAPPPGQTYFPPSDPWSFSDYRGPGGGGGGSDTQSTFGPWTGKFVAPGVDPLPELPLWDPSQSVPNAPQFMPPGWVAPPAFEHPDFVGPTAEQAAQSPGYQFRLNQGTDRLQNAASARGTLNDSGTLKSLIDYGQDAASQEYANVWRRDYDQYTMNRGNALDKYNVNYKTQYVDPYAASYQAAKDQFAPQLTQYEAMVNSNRDLNEAKLLGYKTTAANTQHLNDTRNRNAWDDYFLGWQDYEARRSLATDFALKS